MLNLLSRVTSNGFLALFRIVLGLIWFVDGILEWQPADFNNFAQLVAAASNGQPAPLAALIKAGHAVIAVNPFLANGALATVAPEPDPARAASQRRLLAGIHPAARQPDSG